MELPPNQLSLNITPRHAYAPESFVVHAGAAAVLDHCVTGAVADRFFIAVVLADRRAGKTHFSLRLAADLAAKGLFPRLIEGKDFTELIASPLEIASEDAFIVDDAQAYFSRVAVGHSGPFVAFIEKLRVARASIVFLLDRDIDTFAFDEHVRSRLVPGQGLSIGNPDEADMPALIEAIGKQFGLKLSGRKITFVMKRVGRTVPSVEEYFQRLAHLAHVLGRPIKFPLMSGAA